MCGIAGFYSFSGRLDALTARLLDALTAVVAIGARMGRAPGSAPRMASAWATVAWQLEESGLIRKGILRGDVIRALITAHRAGEVDHAQAIWSLYTACRWYDIVFRAWAPGEHARP